MRFILSLLLLMLFASSTGCDESAVPGSTSAAVDGLPNLQRVDSELDVWVGGQPHPGIGEAALARLGIRTVLVVDAPPPLADSDSIVRVHLPLKYSGIDATESGQLAHLLGSLERPIYIHCHHGTNRAPAAAAVGLVCTGEWSNEQGLALLERAGTDEAFDGLFESVRGAHAMSVSDRPVYDGSSVRIDDLAVSMAEVDDAFLNLERSSKQGWLDAGAAAEAARLVDLLRVSFARTSLNEDLLFRKLATGSIERAAALEASLLAGERDVALKRFMAVDATCIACHDHFRN